MTGAMVLDGGLSTALEQQGADLSGGLWTARLLGEEPERIAAAHRSFFEAGAQVATTASYQASVEGLVAAGYDADEARRLIRLSVGIAREVADEFEGAMVAASVGPYGAYLADGSEYTGRYGVPAARLRDFHGPRLELLAAAGPDLLAVETIPDADEAEVLVALLDDLDVRRLVQLLGARRDHGRRPAARRGVRRPRRLPAARRRRRQLLRPGRRARRGEAAVGATGLPAVAYPNRGGSWDASEDLGVRRPARPRPGAGLARGRGEVRGRVLRHRPRRHRCSLSFVGG